MRGEITLDHTELYDRLEHTELYDNAHTAFQNTQDTAKVVLSGILIFLNEYTGKKKDYQWTKYLAHEVSKGTVI